MGDLLPGATPDSEFARYLDLEIEIRHPEASTGEVLTSPSPPWIIDSYEASYNARAFCEQQFGFEPLDLLPIEVPLVGLRGVAFVRPTQARAGGRPGDRVYVRGMLLAEHNTQLVPDWAVFAQVVLDAGDLAPTASREQLQEGPTLRTVRDQIGVALRSAIENLATHAPPTFDRFVHAHVNSLLAMAAEDPELRALAVRHVPLQTNIGAVPLRVALGSGRVLRYVTARVAFDALSDFVGRQGVLLLNASVVHVPAYLRAVATEEHLELTALDLAALVDGLPLPDAADAPLAARVRDRAQSALDDVAVEVRSFDPPGTASLYVGEPARTNTASDPWDDLLGDGDPAGPRLVLNLASPVVRALADDLDDEVAWACVRALDTLGQLQSGRVLSGTDGSHLGEVLRTLIGATLHRR